MNSLEGISLTEIDEKDIEKKSVTVDESFNNYDDCALTEKKEETYDYSDCALTIEDIEKQKQELENLKNMYNDCLKTNEDESGKVK